jgi:hypothetical protein
MGEEAGKEGDWSEKQQNRGSKLPRTREISSNRRKEKNLKSLIKTTEPRVLDLKMMRPKKERNCKKGFLQTRWPKNK